MSQTFTELTFIDRAIGKGQHSFSLLDSIAPSTLVAALINSTIVFAFSLSFTFNHLSNVVAAIFPCQFTLACDSIASEGTLVLQTVLPDVGTCSMHQA